MWTPGVSAIRNLKSVIKFGGEVSLFEKKHKHERLLLMVLRQEKKKVDSLARKGSGEMGWP